MIVSFQLPMLCRSAGDILEVFLIKHSLVSSHYARLSFAQSFKVEQEASNSSSSSPELVQAQAQQNNVRLRIIILVLVLSKIKSPGIFSITIITSILL